MFQCLDSLHKSKPQQYFLPKVITQIFTNDPQRTSINEPQKSMFLEPTFHQPSPRIL